MTASRFYFCALSKSIWESNDQLNAAKLADLANDALDSERRILKEVNLNGEQLRYTMACQQIEQMVLASTLLQNINNENQFSAALQAGRIPVQVAPVGYLSLLSYAQDEDSKNRIGASFYPPDQVDEHRQVFTEWLDRKQLGHLDVARKRLEFLEYAQKNDCAIVEIQSPFLPIDVTEAQSNWEIYRGASSDEDEETQITLPNFETTGQAVTFFNEENKQADARQLREQVRIALENGEPITIGNQARHDVITEVLHELVFATGPENHPAVLRIAYVDGTEGEPFPIFCLQNDVQSNQDDNEFLSAALMSVRHYELDEVIDFCWFRNREVSQSRTLAESDSFCYKNSLEQLRLALNDGDFRLDLYHTGFEPAVIGFYRALVRAMLKRPTKQIIVRPMYFRGTAGYEAGSLWAN